MNEADVTKACAGALIHALGPSVYYKHCDRTAGRPDSTFSWNGRTSWIEFKMLEGEGELHTKGKSRALDRGQLVELIRLERAGVPAWVVAYRKRNTRHPARVSIYRPSALLREYGTVTPVYPEFSTYDNILEHLRQYGVATFEGFDHKALISLILKTHV